MLDHLVKIAPLISASAITISACVAFCVFIYTRRANRRRATLDMVMRTFLDENGTKIYDKFKTLTRKHEDSSDTFTLESLVEYTEENAMDRNAVIDQLNNYELAALGVMRGVFDESFYKLWFHGQFTKDYEKVSCLIEAIQSSKGPSAYCEFKALYHRWMKNKHPVNRPSRWKMAWWGLTKNHEHLGAIRT